VLGNESTLVPVMLTPLRSERIRARPTASTFATMSQGAPRGSVAGVAVGSQTRMGSRTGGISGMAQACVGRAMTP